MRVFKKFAACAIIGATFTVPHLALAQVVDQKNISLRLAWTVAQAALESCSKQGFRNSLHIVDRSGQVIIAIKGDDTSPHTYDLSFRKAYTARALQIPTTEFAKRLADPALAAIATQVAVLPNMIGLGGGVPIKAGNVVIGAVGISGAPSPLLDEECAKAGIASVADQLK